MKNIFLTIEVGDLNTLSSCFTSFRNLNIVTIFRKSGRFFIEYECLMFIFLKFKVFYLCTRLLGSSCSLTLLLSSMVGILPHCPKEPLSWCQLLAPPNCPGDCWPWRLTRRWWRSGCLGKSCWGWAQSSHIWVVISFSAEASSWKTKSPDHHYICFANGKFVAVTKIKF